MMRRLPAIPLILMVVAPLLTGMGRAEPPATKTIRHWTAACDNLRSCSAFGFATTLDETMIGAWIRLDRSGEANAAPHLEAGFSLADGGDDTPKQLTLKVGGNAPLGPFAIEEGDNYFFAKVADTDVTALLAALRKADFIQLSAETTKGEKLEATLSLEGASAALLWLDDEQQRIGTVTALVKRGSKPGSAVPPVPALPILHRAPPTKPVGQTLPPAILDLAKQGDCADAMDQIEPIVGDLGGGVMLYGALCGSGAYNFAAPFWTVTSGGMPQPASFPLPPSLVASEDEGGDPEGDGILVNPSFDETSLQVQSYAKGRGIADCGSAGSWVWDGSAFQLEQYSLMTECEGVPSGAWPVLYRAEVR